MPTIDERVVQLQFDNKQFESGVRTSLNTLNKFDSQLNGLDFSKMSSGIDGLSKKFSVLGVAGITAVSRITNSLMDFGKKKWNESFGQIITGGMSRAQNIADAKFMLKGLGLEWDKQLSDITLTTEHMTKEEKKLGKVTDSISDDIDYGVKDTAYGLDAAAKAAAQLKASSVEVGDPMRTALRGISGVAAMTNSSYEDISAIFTTVAGQGKLMTMQLRQLETRGMNAAATLGEQLGKSEAEIRDMTTKGKIDFEMFAKAMDDAFGEHAKDANQTFQGASSNLRAALSRIGADFYSVYMDKMIPVLNAVKTIVNDIRKFTQPASGIFEQLFGGLTGETVKSLERVHTLLNEMVNGGAFKLGKDRRTPLHFFKETLEAIGNITVNIAKPLKDAFSNVFPPITYENILKASKALNDFVKKIKKGSESVKTYNSLKIIFEGLFSIVKIGVQVLNAAVKATSKLLQYLAPLGQKLLNLVLNLSLFIKKVADSGKVVDILSRVIYTLASPIRFLSDIFNSVSEKYTEFRAKLENKIQTPGLAAILTILDGVKTAFLTLFGVAEETDKKIMDLNIFRFIGSGVGKAFDFVGGIAKDLFKSVDSAGDSFLSIISDFFGKVTDAIVPRANGAAVTVLDVIKGILIKLKSAFTNGLNAIVDWLHKPVYEKINDITHLEKALLRLLKTIRKIVKEIEKIKGIIELEPVFRRLTKSVARAVDPNSSLFSLEKLFPKISSSLSSLMRSFKHKNDFAAMKDFAKSILMLSGALFVLAMIPADKLFKAGLTIAFLMGSLVAVIKKLEGMNTRDLDGGIFGDLLGAIEPLAKSSMIIAAASAIISLGIAVSLLSGVILLLEKTFAKDPKGTLIAAGIAVGLIGALVFAINRINVKSGKKAIASAMAMIGVADAVLLLGLTIRMLASAFSADPAAASSAVLSTIGIMILAVASLNSISIKSGTKAIAASKALIKMGEALLLIGLTVKLISSAFSSDPTAAASAVLSTIGIMILMVATLNSISIKSGSKAKAAGFALVEVGAALVLIGVTISKITSAYSSNSEGAAFAVLSTIGTMILLAAVLNSISIESGGKAKAAGFAIIEIAFALTLIGNAVTAIADAYKGNESGTLISVASVIVFLGAVVIALNNIDPYKAGENALAMVRVAFSLVAISHAVKSIGDMDWDSIIKGLVGLAAIFAIIGGFAAIVGGTGIVAAGLAVIAATIVGIGIALLAAGTGMAMFGLGIKALAAGVTALATAWATSGQLIIEGIRGTLGAFASMIPSIAAEFANGLFIFAEICASHLPTFIDLGMQIMAAIATGLIQNSEKIATVMITVLTNVLALLAQNIGSIAESLNTIMISLIEKIDWARIFTVISSGFGEIFGTGIGSAIGSALGSIMQGIIDAIAQVDYTSLATHLNGFIEELTPFIEGSKLIDAQCMEGIKNLAKAVIILTAADFIDGIAKFPFGDSSLEKMGKELTKFAPYLTQFADSTASINASQFGMVSAAMLVLFKAASEAPNSGGLLGKIIGENDLGSFGANLGAFGYALKTFGWYASQIDSASIIAVSPAMISLFKAAEQAPNSGGLLGTLMGENDLGSFGENLGSFGYALKTFGWYASQVDAAAISTVSSVMYELFSALQKIPNEGGFISEFVGDNSVSQMSDNLGELGKSIYVFGYYASQTDLTAMASAIASIGELIALFQNGSPFDEYMVSGFVEAMQTLATTSVKELCDSFTNNPQYDVLAAVQMLLDDIADAFTSFDCLESVDAVAYNIITTLGNGLQKYEEYATSRAREVGDHVATALGAGVGDGPEYGETADAILPIGFNVDNTLGESILDNEDLALDPAKELGKLTVDAISEGAEENSEGALSGVRSFIKGIFEAPTEIDTSAAEAEAAAAGIRIGNSFYKALASGDWRYQEYLVGKANSFLNEWNQYTNSSRYTEKGNAEYIKQWGELQNKINSQFENVTGEMLKTEEEAVNKDKDLKDTALGNLSNATGKASKTQSKFVLDNSEFWKTLYAQNQSGIYGAHNQLEKFADWEEATVKKVESIVKDFKENGLSNAIKETNSGLFSKVSEEKKEVSKEELKKNLQDQIAQIQDYNRTMAQLEYRITDVNLRDAIAEMGMDSLAELKALNSMTDQELTEYTGLYNQKLLANFNGIKDKASMQVSELLGGAPMDITQLATSWDGTAKQLGEMAANAIRTHFSDAISKGINLDQATLDGMKLDKLAPQLQTQLTDAAKSIFGSGASKEFTSQGTNLADNLLVDGVQAEMKNQQDPTAKIGQDVMDATVTEMGKAIGDDVKPNDPAQQGIYIGQNLMLGIQKGIEDEQEPLEAMMKTLMDNLIELVDSYTADFEDLGEMIGEGLAKGIKDSIEEVTSSMDDVADNGVIKPFQEKTDEQSPSKLFEQFGVYLNQGLANGIQNSIGLVTNATSAITDAITSVGDAVNGNRILSPVLDLSSIGSSVMQMNSMLNDRKLAIANAKIEADSKFMDQMAKAFSTADNKPNNITNNITVDGAENPNLWAQSFVNTMRREMRMANG